MTGPGWPPRCGWCGLAGGWKRRFRERCRGGCPPHPLPPPRGGEGSAFVGSRWFFVLVLVTLGVGWGSTQSLGKMATATGHQPFGLIFWQLLVGALVLGAVSLARGKGMVFTRPALRFYVVIAVIGTLIPNATFYAAVVHLPAGIMSILISTVPFLAFPMALALGLDRFSAGRLAGLALGLVGVAVLGGVARRNRRNTTASPVRGAALVA
ncbi:MAG: DMT family transporter [Rhodobacteraceae bacterium]|nr:DMT family transporter [Paracoccaceae bacterium]